jgi:CHAD domain-containing protein
MSENARHRLRLRNKRLYYSIEFLDGVLSGPESSKRQKVLKYLRKAQRHLGQLNDDARGRSLRAELLRDGVEPSTKLLRSGREKRLIRAAAAAYLKLATLKPLKAGDFFP